MSSPTHEISNKVCKSDHPKKPTNTSLHGKDEQNSEVYEVFVTRFSPDINQLELREHFSQYGEVLNVSIDKKRKAYAFIKFATYEDVLLTMSSNHYLYGHQLIVKQSDSMYRQITRIDSIIPFSQLTVILEQCSSVSEQIEVFCQRIRLTEDEIRSRQSICSDLESVLRKYYRDCRLFMFGSSANGFGFKGSDVDLLFEPFPGYWDQTDFAVNMKEDGQPISVQDVEQKVVNALEVALQPPKEQVKFLAKVLRKHRYMFMRSQFIPARCPIVKFVHKKLLLQCDLSCSNQLVLYNTQLLQFFGKLDSRVNPLMILLRYWGKLRHLINVRALSSYAFSMLILFFLQTRQPKVVPSVMELRSLAAPEESRIAAGWDVTFCTDLSRVAPSQNTESLEDLVLGFFEFYSEFDFSYVVSTLMAEKLERNCFDIADAENDAHNFKSAPLCIQDPLERDRNLTAFVNVKVLVMLKEKMVFAASSLSASRSSKDSSAFGILSIFQDTHTSINVLEIIPNEHILPSPAHGLMFTLMFSDSYKDCLFDVKHDGSLWMSKVSSTLYKIFEQGLNFEAEVIDRFDSFPCGHIDRKRRAINSSFSPVSKVPRLDTSIEVISESDASCGENGKTDSEKVQHLTADIANSMPSEDLNNTNIEPTKNHPKLIFDETVPVRDSISPLLLVSIQNIVTYDVWNGRRQHKKSVGNYLTLQKKHEYIELEHAVSKEIMEGSPKLKKTIYFTCDCYMYREKACDKLIFQLKPLEYCSEFKTMSLFLKSFILYMLNHALQ